MKITEPRKMLGKVLVVAVLLAILAFAWTNIFTFYNSSAQEYVWCFDTVSDKDGGIQTFGHRPTTSDMAKFAQSLGAQDVQTKCFTNWADVALFITDGQVKLPADATQDDYVRATDEFFKAKGPPPGEQK